MYDELKAKSKKKKYPISRDPNLSNPNNPNYIGYSPVSPAGRSRKIRKRNRKYKASRRAVNSNDATLESWEQCPSPDDDVKESKLPVALDGNVKRNTIIFCDPPMPLADDAGNQIFDAIPNTKSRG